MDTQDTLYGALQQTALYCKVSHSALFINHCDGYGRATPSKQHYMRESPPLLPKIYLYFLFRLE